MTVIITIHVLCNVHNLRKQMPLLPPFEDEAITELVSDKGKK